MKEVQYIAMVDSKNLVLDREVKNIFQVTCEYIILEKEEKKHTYNLEKKFV
jgi:hypothetical protein